MKKVGIIASLSIIAVLIITVLVMAFVPVSYAIKYENPDEIHIYNSSSSYEKTTKEQTEKIESLLEDSFKESALTSLFNGRISEEYSIEQYSNKTLSTTSSVLVSFVYGESSLDAKLPTMKDGSKDYKNSSNSTVQYKSLIFQISSENKLNYINVYVETESDYNKNSNNGSVYYSYVYKVLANTSELYEYVTNL